MKQDPPPEPENRDLWHEARRSIERLDRGALSMRSLRSLLGFAALGVSAALVVFATLLCGTSIQRLREGFAWVAHTNEVIYTIDGIQQDLLRAEGDMRAYILSGDATFLDGYRPARAALLHGLGSLAALTADNPAQLRHIAALGPLIAARLRRFDDSARWGVDRLARAVAASRDPAQTQNRHKLAAAINAQIEGLRATERILLGERQRETERRSGGALFLALIAAALAVVAGAVGAVVVSRERMRLRGEILELELMHKQREIMMDQASVMLAHEINQPLAAASNYLSAVQRLAGNAGASNLAEVAQKAAGQVQRAGEIVGRLRRFIERKAPEHRLERPEALIADAMILLGTLDGEIQVETSAAPNLPAVIADSVQIQQVLVNLLRNGLEAMQGSDHRALYLSAKSGPSGDVLFALRDTGTGFTKDVARNLFKPMASTKHSGMGVGLSICRTIVQAHGGRIWAEPAEEGGAVFRFTLPADSDGNIAA